MIMFTVFNSTITNIRLQTFQTGHSDRWSRAQRQYWCHVCGI